MSFIVAYILLLIAVLLGIIGQLLLKRGMSQRPDFQLRQIWTLISDPSILAGFFSYGLSTLIYLQSLEILDLSLAYPTVSLGYVLVILLSKILFKEKVNLTRWIAVIIICAGVVLVGFGA